MTEYPRPKVPGATWFFTVNLAQRDGSHLLVAHIGRLRYNATLALSAYRSLDQEQALAAQGYRSHIHRKGQSGKPPRLGTLLVQCA
jgi:hypothetical protein